MILLCNQQSFICTHIDYCHPHCYLHHSRSCARLVRAIKLLYGDTVDSLRENSTLNSAARGKKQKEVSIWKKRTVSMCLFIYLFIYFSWQGIITFKNCIMHSDRVLSWQNEHSAFLNPVLLKKLLNHLALWKECNVCCLGRMLVADQPLESSPFFSCSFLSVKKNHSWNSCKILHNISFRSELSDRFQELYSLVFHVMLSLVTHI